MKLMGDMVAETNFSLTEIENMIIWERDVFVTIRNTKITEEENSNGY